MWCPFLDGFEEESENLLWCCLHPNNIKLHSFHSYWINWSNRINFFLFSAHLSERLHWIPYIQRINSRTCYCRLMPYLLPNREGEMLFSSLLLPISLFQVTNVKTLSLSRCSFITILILLSSINRENSLGEIAEAFYYWVEPQRNSRMPRFFHQRHHGNWLVTNSNFPNDLHWARHLILFPILFSWIPLEVTEENNSVTQSSEKTPT